MPEFNATWASALLSPQAPVPEGVIDPQGRVSTRRFNVYRNNVVASLKDALRTAFPVVEKLVGEEFFSAMAGEFVRTHPPKSPILMFYGDEFATFLERFPPVAGLPYLPDVARLEQARREVYHAHDASVIAPQDLMAIQPDVLEATTLTLHPAHALICTPHPVLHIWARNSGVDAPADDGQCDVLVTRPAQTVICRNVPVGFHSFLEAAADHTPIGALAEISGDVALFQTYLGIALEAGLIAGLRPSASNF